MKSEPVAVKQRSTLVLAADELQLFESLIRREVDANGGAVVVSVDQRDLDDPNKLRLEGHTHDYLLSRFVIYFLDCVYSESKFDPVQDESFSDDDENEPIKPLRQSAANYVLGVVHHSAEPMPCIISYFAEQHPQMLIKSSLLLNSKEICTMRMADYHRSVCANYLNGTYRYGPLLQTSIVGVCKEEVGDYFPDFIGPYLEGNRFLSHMMPWGDYAITEGIPPTNSDDGPIIWARPGEQMIPTTHTNDNPNSPSAKKYVLPLADTVFISLLIFLN